MNYDSVFNPGVRVKHSLLQTFAINLIDLYQKQISANLPARCSYYPTCSHYGKQAIERYGVIKGSYLAFARLCRCRPGMGGYDPIPQNEEELIINLTTWRIRLRSESLPISWYFKSPGKRTNSAQARTFHLVLSFPNLLDSEKTIQEKIVKIITDVNFQKTKSFQINNFEEIRSRRGAQRFYRVIGKVQLPCLQSKASFEKELVEYCSTVLVGEVKSALISFASYGLPKRNMLPHAEPCSWSLGTCCWFAVF
ncbi:MAG: membrane protein insertion efficiency factor YidD [Rivularia sp. (in: cyanobacteria)]